MSQRSRRFLAAQEAATHPSMKEHAMSATAVADAPLVPSLADAVDSTNKGYRFDAKATPEDDEEDEEATAQEGPGYLERSRERIAGMTQQLVAWGKEHPVRTAVAAAALIAASGLLYQAMNGKAGKVATAVAAARTVKTRVKNKVKALVTGRTTGRGSKRKAASAT
jgi:hypothetical protein